jgi:hypothetical protein
MENRSVLDICPVLVAWQRTNLAYVSACKLKVKFTIEEAKKAQKGSTIIALVFL